MRGTRNVQTQLKSYSAAHAHVYLDSHWSTDQPILCVTMLPAYVTNMSVESSYPRQFIFSSKLEHKEVNNIGIYVRKRDMHFRSATTPDH